MAILEDYEHIKAYYTGTGRWGILGNFTFSVPENAVELPWKYVPSYDAITDGNGNAICSSTCRHNSSLMYYTESPNSTAGWFYFINVNGLWIADRPVITYVTWDELDAAGYTNGDLRLLTYEEYGQTISQNPDPAIWNNIPQYSSLGDYKGAYGEWTSTPHPSDNNMITCISNLKQESDGDKICYGDYYYTQTANKYNSKSIRNFLNGANNGIGQYIPAVYRPVFDDENLISKINITATYPKKLWKSFAIMDYPMAGGNTSNKATSPAKVDFSKLAGSYDKSMDAWYLNGLASVRNYAMDLTGDFILQFDYYLDSTNYHVPIGGWSWFWFDIFAFGTHNNGGDKPTAAISVYKNRAVTTIYNFSEGEADANLYHKWHTFTIKGTKGDNTEFYLDGQLKNRISNLGIQNDFYLNGKCSGEVFSSYIRNFKFAIGKNSIDLYRVLIDNFKLDGE